MIGDLFNWELRRPYESALSTRKRGFTEHWGEDDSLLKTQRGPSPWDHEADNLHLDEASSIRLVQYWPAWAEQLALRMADVPHIVVNSRFPATEICGPLPLIVDIRRDEPAMTGRRTRRFSIKSDIQTLAFLEERFGFNADRVLPHADRTSSQLLIAKIVDEMDPCLVALYDNESSGVFSFERRWRSQAWGNRYQRFSMEEVEDARQFLLKSYSLIESTLSKSKTSYLLGSETPCTADIILWNHIMNAVPVLPEIRSQFSLLHSFQLLIWNTFFEIHDGDSVEWKVRNIKENFQNPFVSLALVEAQLPVVSPQRVLNITWDRWCRGGEYENINDVPSEKANIDKKLLPDDMWLAAVLLSSVSVLLVLSVNSTTAKL